MENIQFSWDAEKDRSNRGKHGVSFEEAKSVFFDEYALEAEDREHSESEDRFLMLGMSVRLRMLVVCHCLRENGSVIRLISARRATRKEIEYYGENRHEG